MSALALDLSLMAAKSGIGAPIVIGNFLITQNGDFIITQDGDFIIWR